MLILIPSILIFCCIRSRDNTISPVVVGTFVGVCVCMFIAFFSFKHRIPEYSFGINFLYYALIEYVLPLILLYVSYFFVSKDSLEFRIKTFFPITASFFSIYMPYCILSSADAAFSFFDLFVKPVVFLSMLIISAYFVFFIAKVACERNVKKIIILSVLFSLALFVPPFFNTIWLLKIMLPIVYLGSVIYSVFAIILFAISIRSADGILL